MSNPPVAFDIRVDQTHAGTRLDALVAAQVEHCSRSFAAVLIQKGAITVDGIARKASYLVKAGETVSGAIQKPETPSFQPEDIPLEILYEDDELLVVNKAPGMVVHPAPGHASGTLVNALTHHCPDLLGISGSLRPGIVHRLDRDTSGALVVAKTNGSMHGLAAQFKSREVRKQYLALVYGVMKEDRGRIDRPIGRHPTDRKRMSVVSRTPRAALTTWKVRKRFDGVSLLELDIHTGRTHQIRVHCHAIGHPVVGDPMYTNRGSQKQLGACNRSIFAVVGKLRRQMLHAWRLTIHHPVSGRTLTVTAPLPEDMKRSVAKIGMLSNLVS